jgi:hypothetical protein
MSINERLVALLRRLAHTDRTVLELLLAAVLIGLSGAVLFGGSAHGQLLLPDGKVNGECGPTPRVPPLPVPALPTLPQADMPTQATVSAAAGIPLPGNLPAQIGGSGTRAVIDLNAKGAAIGWWVPKVGRVDLYLYAVTWAHLVANPGLAARLLLLAAMPSRDSAAVAAIGAAYAPTLHILDMCDVWAPLVAALNASKPAPLDPAAPPSAYVVTASASGTRAAYAVVGGKRSTLASGIAVAGQPCDCAALQIIEFNVVRYCASPSITGISGPAVTACSPRR